MADSTDEVPQFVTAEYKDQSAGGKCRGCGRDLGIPHYRVNSLPTCAACAEQIRSQFPTDSHAAFGRAILFGIAGALLGLVLYVVFAVSTGLVIGFVSLAVGYIVGKAMKFGSGGRGGRRYQIVALLLTYAAVSLSAVPIALSSQFKHSDAQMQTQTQAQTQNGGAASAPVTTRSLGSYIGRLAILGLASPFLDLSDPTHGIIGLIILFVGLRIAWQLTAGRNVEIMGPFTEAAPVAPG